MKLDLNKKDLISLAKGTSPNYAAMKIPKIKENGVFEGSYGRWTWNYDAFENLTEEEIYNIYLICRESWIVI